MKKKLFFVLLFALIFLVLVFFLYLKFSNKNLVDNDNKLSARSEEFIKTQQQKDNEFWQTVDVQKEEDISRNNITNEQTINKNCFKIIFPIPVINIVNDNEGRCRTQAKTIKPPGLIVVSSYTSSSFNEDTAILLREKNPTDYKKINSAISESEIAIYQSKEEVTLFSQKNQTMLTISFNKSSPNEDQVKTLEKLFENITLETASASATIIKHE